MFLSIVIPIYNVESYIEKCFDSLFKQDLSSSLYEIIAVNDGSLDHSMEIVERYAKKYDNIVVYNKSNGGVSSARNVGIGLASGNYIVFVDPDDSIAENSLSKIYENLKKESTDMLIMRSFIEGGMERYAWSNFCPINKDMNGIDIFKKGYVRGSVCGVGYNRLFILKHSLLFVDGLTNGEDSLFFSLSLLHASKVRFADILFYYIYVRIDSASRDFNIEKIWRISNNLRAINHYLTDPLLTTEQKSVLYYQQYAVISSAVNHYTKLHKFNWIQLKKKLELSKMLPIKIDVFLPQRSKIRLLNFSFFLYFFFVFMKNICKR